MGIEFYQFATFLASMFILIISSTNIWPSSQNSLIVIDLEYNENAASDFFVTSNRLELDIATAFRLLSENIPAIRFYIKGKAKVDYNLFTYIIL